MRLTKDTIDQIQQSIDIVEVINDFVSLKRKGHYYSACCPFHNEKTPSFTVTPSKGIYKCFGCGKGGDAIQFVMEHEGSTYVEAMVYMAKKYNIEIKEEEQTEEQNTEQNEKDSMLVVTNYASQYYSDQLWNSEEGKSIGLSYFKERGFREETIRKFELGYSQDQWDAFTQAAITNGYSTEFLTKTGLSIERDNANDSRQQKFFDRFRGRVMFPIHSVAGRVTAFGARILKTDKTQAKYLNSTESAIYHKSKILYGMFQAKQAIRKEEECLLVEGYTDVISLHQAGIEHAVSSSGTSLTEDQIKLVKRYTPNITVLYDGDSAGLKASLRGVDLILQQDMNVSVVVFPEGEDPDSYVQKIGPTAFREYIKSHKRDFISFKTEISLKEIGNDPIKRAEVIRDIVDSISKVPDAIKRAVFFRECSKLLEIDEQILITEYNKKALQKDRQEISKRENDRTAAVSLQDIPEIELPDDIIKLSFEEEALRLHERDMMRYLLNYASSTMENEVPLSDYLITELQDVEFKNPAYDYILKKVIELRKEGHQVDHTYFLQQDQEPHVRDAAINLLTNKFQVSENWEKFQIEVPKEADVLTFVVTKTVLRLKRVVVKCMIRENIKEIERVQKADNVDELMHLLQVAVELKNISKEIDKTLGIVVG
ncbi:MAG: DNA primase [Cytophagales bacterium]|nr:DNA primase [Cytophaga sp.]